MKIKQTMSEFLLALAQKEIAEDVLGVKHVVNTSRKALNDFNKKLGKELHVKTTDNPTLTNIIKDTAKIKKANVHYEPNTSLWYKIDGDTLYIRGHEAEGYSERVLYTDATLAKNGWYNASNKNQITKAVIEEIIVPISCTRLFDGCKSLLEIENFSNIKITHHCTSLHTMFLNCNSITNIDTSDWDVCNVTKIDGIFYSCSKLSYIDCSKWNTSKIVSMKLVFLNCCNLKSVGNLNDWDTSNVTDMQGMFYDCRLLESVGNLSRWDVSNVVSMFSMFMRCVSLNSIGNLNYWNISNVTDMSNMFHYGYNVYDDDNNSMNKEAYKEYIGINNIPTTISIPPIPKDCNISNIFLRQKFIEDIVYCGKISQSFTTKYGVAIQDNMSSLTRESILKIINALDPENPGTLTLCEPNYEKLTDEDKAIATSKGWTIVA